jgi:hypothetical protein
MRKDTNTLNTAGFPPQGAYQNKENHAELWLENIFKRGQLGDQLKTKLNSVACNPQANYTDRAAAAYFRS